MALVQCQVAVCCSNWYLHFCTYNFAGKRHAESDTVEYAGRPVSEREAALGLGREVLGEERQGETSGTVCCTR